jgi:hypothetical protein
MFAVAMTVCFMGTASPICFKPQMAHPYQAEGSCNAALVSDVSEWRRGASEVGWDPIAVRAAKCVVYDTPRDDD